VQREDIDGAVIVRIGLDSTQRHLMCAASTLLGEMLAGVVDEDAAHELGGDAVELCSVLPGRVPLIDETHVRFVDERRRLQCVPVVLASHGRGGTPMQLGVDDGKQPVPRGAIAVAPGDKKPGDVRGILGSRHGWRRYVSHGVTSRNPC